MKKVGIRLVVVGWLAWFACWFAYGQFVNATAAGIRDRLPAGETVDRQATVDAMESLSHRLAIGATQFSLVAPVLITLGAVLIYRSNRRGEEGKMESEPDASSLRR